MPDPSKEGRLIYFRGLPNSSLPDNMKAPTGTPVGDNRWRDRLLLFPTGNAREIPVGGFNIIVRLPTKKPTHQNAYPPKPRERQGALYDWWVGIPPTMLAKAICHHLPLPFWWGRHPSDEGRRRDRVVVQTLDRAYKASPHLRWVKYNMLYMLLTRLL